MSFSKQQKKSINHYEVYGLVVASEIELPELSRIEKKDCDVRIVVGDVPSSLENRVGRCPWAEYGHSTCLISIVHVGRFLVRDGKEIVIDRRSDRSRDRGTGAPEADIRLYLLGSAFGALLHQRGWLPLHVSAVGTSVGVLAFTGKSGAGKSTLAGWFHRNKGWPIISDDVSVLRPEDAKPTLHPGPRKLKLWEDAVEHLDCKNDRLVQDLSNTPKFQLYLSDQDAVSPSPLRALIVLERCDEGEEPSLFQLKGSLAFDACMQSVYRPYMADWFRDSTHVMRDLLSLCGQIEVYRYRRRWALEDIEEQLDPLFYHFVKNRNVVNL